MARAEHEQAETEPDLAESEHRQRKELGCGNPRDAVRKGQADHAAEQVRQRGRGHHRRALVPPHQHGHGRDHKDHETGERDPEHVGAAAGAADDDDDAAQRDEHRQQRSRPQAFAQPDPGNRRGNKRSGCDDDRDIRHAGELQRGDERDHAQHRQGCHQPAALAHVGKVAKAGGALRQ